MQVESSISVLLGNATDVEVLSITLVKKYLYQKLTT